jgi:DNA end-binding protein Ku
MLDSRDQSPVRYERVNSETGEEVPWKDVVKAFEFDKGNYVVLEEEDFKAAAPESRETVEMSSFVDAGAIDTRYFEKPYVLVPGKKAEKGYVLLRETLEKLGKVGVARVVIRTREYLCMVKPHDDALLLVLLRYPQELVDLADYSLPEKASGYRISKAEMDMASQLIKSMAGEWRPDEYRDDYRDRLRKAIDQRINEKGATTRVDDDDGDVPEDATTNVVDFMSLLKKSLDSNRRTPAAKATGGAKPRGKAAVKVPVKKAAKKAAKKAPGKAAGKAPAKKARPAPRKPAARKTPKAANPRTAARKTGT